jgi:hypothetical protein
MVGVSRDGTQRPKQRDYTLRACEIIPPGWLHLNRLLLLLAGNSVPAQSEAQEIDYLATKTSRRLLLLPRVIDLGTKISYRFVGDGSREDRPCPISMLTCHVVAPGFMPTILALSRLRALIFTGGVRS